METIITVSLTLTALVLINGAVNFYKNHKNTLEIKKQENLVLKEKEKTEKEKQLPSSSNQDNLKSWKTYKNQKYGFQIRYPEDWTVSQKQSSLTESKIYFEKQMPIKKTDTAKQLEDYRNLSYGLDINYPKNLSQPSNQTPNLETETRGFYVLISNIPKSPETQITDKSIFPQPNRSSNYRETYSLPIETNACYAREITFLKNNFYFKRTYFYAMASDKYTFQIVPFREKDGNYSFFKNKNEARKVLPEFALSASNFFFYQEIIIPKVIKKAYLPISTGKISCRKKNDHPGKSDTKGKHMDEDCCPDPDEWPKPGCIYSPKGYAIMLKGPPGKKK